MICLLSASPWVLSLPASAGDAAPEEEAAPVEEAAPAETMVEKVKDTDVSIYGRFWPKLTYTDNGGSSTDLTDALSRVGLKANTQITDTLSAVLHGEWDVDIDANGDFGDARLAYVGIKSSDLGFIAIGKQWDPYYNLIAEVTDIHYHRASPFGYDNEGPFRNNNLLRYTHSIGLLTLDSGIQLNGSPENNAGESHNFFRQNSDVSSDSDHVDAASVGVSMRVEDYYLGIAYLRQNRDGAGLERNFLGIGASVKCNFIEGLYLAATYQYIIDNYDNGDEMNPYTLDVGASLAMGSGMTAIGGFFLYDDDVSGADSGEKLGGAVTLVKEVHPSTDVFVEWVITDPEYGDTTNTLSLGFRYDFDVAIF